jgi:hypothetical protein
MMVEVLVDSMDEEVGNVGALHDYGVEHCDVHVHNRGVALVGDYFHGFHRGDTHYYLVSNYCLNLGVMHFHE